MKSIYSAALAVGTLLVLPILPAAAMPVTHAATVTAGHDEGIGVQQVQYRHGYAFRRGGYGYGRPFGYRRYGHGFRRPFGYGHRRFGYGHHGYGRRYRYGY